MSDSLVTAWMAACQDPLSKGSPRQEYWSGLPFPSPGDLPGMEPMSSALGGGEWGGGGFFTIEPPEKPIMFYILFYSLGLTHGRQFKMKF